MAESREKWWKECTLYQIYPISYKDSNGDGLGDLPGILSKMDYLKELGIDAFWISPFFDSPQKDFGYDIADYQKPCDVYGKVEDVEAIIKAAHDRGLKVLFDLVINHTSDQHRWFKEARKSRDNPYRKYYIWKEGRTDKDGNKLPPTNWEATFGGSAWEWNEATQDYYLHTFVVEQPDLNWELAEVRQAIYDEAIIFWLEKGLDGFRCDVINFISKHDYEDVPVVRESTYVQPASHKFIDGPRVLEFHKEMIATTFAKYNAITLAELPGQRTVEQALKYLAEDSKCFNMSINFDIAGLDHGIHGLDKYLNAGWKLSDFKRITEKEQSLTSIELNAWVCTYLENHDQARMVSRFMSDAPEHRVIAAKSLAIYIMTLTGCAVIYQGQELGMCNFSSKWGIEEYKDPASQMQMATVKEMVANGNTDVSEEESLRSLAVCARDHARTPMQWSSETSAGFSTSGNTWMRVMDDYKEFNVEVESKDPNSVLNFYKNLLKFRKQHKPSLMYGSFEYFDKDNEETFVYHKKSDKETLAVAINFTAKTQKVKVPGAKDILMSSSTNPGSDKFTLEAYEARIYSVEA